MPVARLSTFIILIGTELDAKMEQRHGMAEPWSARRPRVADSACAETDLRPREFDLARSQWAKSMARRCTSSPTRSRSGPTCWRLSLTLGFCLRGEAKLAQPRRFRRLHGSLPLALLKQLRVAPFGREPVLLRFPSTIGLDWLAVSFWH